VHGRFGVGVDDPEDADRVVHPVPHDPQDLGVEPLEVVVEAHRVDVLVLLGRVLGVGDGSVGASDEPLGVFGDPGVIGGALQGQVQGDLHAVLVGLGDEGVEVFEGAEVGVDGVVAAVLGADGPHRAGVAGPRGQGVVGAFAVAGAHRVDRWQVHHVETHVGDGGQALGGGGEGAREFLAGKGV